MSWLGYLMEKNNLQLLFFGFSPLYRSFWNYVSFLASSGGEEIFPMGKCVLDTASWCCNISSCLSVTLNSKSAVYLFYTIIYNYWMTIVLWHQGNPANCNSVESLKISIFSSEWAERSTREQSRMHTHTLNVFFQPLFKVCLWWHNGNCIAEPTRVDIWQDTFHQRVVKL